MADEEEFIFDRLARARLAKSLLGTSPDLELLEAEAILARQAFKSAAQG